MCIRDRSPEASRVIAGEEEMGLFTLYPAAKTTFVFAADRGCLLYTSDAADDLLCVDLGGRRIIKKKTQHNHI